MGSSILIPVLVFLPYYEAFIPEAFSFAYELLYDELFFSRLMMENQLLFSLPNLDIFSRLVPHLGIFGSLTSVTTLIHRTGSHRVSRVLSAESIGKPRLSTFSKRTSISDPRRQSVAAYATRKRKTLVHVFFFIWGLVVLVLHARAAIRAQTTVVGCHQVTSSWFSKEYPCSAYTYNCYRHGTVTPDEDSWKELDQSNLVYLAISHCSELRVPHRFQSFSNLLGLTLFNSTIVEWSKESSISATKRTKMAVLVIARTNMTRIPDGMLEPLPESLMDIEMTYTNLTSLPDDLHERWHPIASFCFEHSQITEFPTVLLALQVQQLSLQGNLIERLPDFSDIHQYFYVFTASDNPILELPETLGEGTAFGSLGVENTLIKTQPAWLHTNVKLAVYLHGSPYCETQPGDVADGPYLLCVEHDTPAEGKCVINIFQPHTPV